MEREILFRGKRVDTGEWVYGDLIKHSIIDPFTYIAIGIGYKVDNPEIGKAIKVLPNTVGIFIGRTDVNGVKIFEGDHDKDGNCVVFCDECAGWQFAQIDMPTKDICIPCYNCEGHFMFQDWIGAFEIIGNIHDK